MAKIKYGNATEGNVVTPDLPEKKKEGEVKAHCAVCGKEFPFSLNCPQIICASCTNKDKDECSEFS